MVKIVAVDDHKMVRAGLEQLLSTEHDLALVGVAADGKEAVEVVARERPNVVLMDLSMPEGDGVEATEVITKQYPDCKVLVLTSFSDQKRITEAFDAGADGYLLKHSEPDAIIAAIRAIHLGDSPVDPKVARVLLNSRRLRSLAEHLSEREREVLGLVRDGLSNRLIAHRLELTERTVKSHLTRIFHQIEVSDRTQAAVWAVRNLA